MVFHPTVSGVKHVSFLTEESLVMRDHGWVCVQIDGCNTPGSGIAVQKTKVRGIESSGMLCSAYDVGWVGVADGVLLELPSTFSPGAVCPSSPAQVNIMFNIVGIGDPIVCA